VQILRYIDLERCLRADHVAPMSATTRMTEATSNGRTKRVINNSPMGAVVAAAGPFAGAPVVPHVE
jgi:hypothetical protein